jgi:hypothetical protein
MGMMFAVHKGRRYRAAISLGWVERFATNEMIAQRLRDAGFSEVLVVGSGGTREAKALWSGEDAAAEIPSQISSIDELQIA